MKSNLKSIVLMIATVFAGSAMAQTKLDSPAANNAGVTQASPGVTSVAPGFAPPGLNEMVLDVDAQKPVLKASPGKVLIPGAVQVADVPMATPAILVAKPKVKTRDEIAIAEARKFKPTGKNVVVSNSTDQPEFDTNMPFAGKPLLRSGPLPKMEPVINAKMGEPVNISISIGSLNRIVTPFSNAVVDTLSKAKIKTTGGVIVVAAESEETVSLIVREKDAPESAVMMNLFPQSDISARDVQVNASFAKRNSVDAKDGDTPERESAHPIAVKLKNIMRDMAKGRVPSGYSIEKGNNSSANCNLPGFDTQEAQVLVGANLTIRVYAAKNIAEGENEMDERGCSGRKQLASAAWPKLAVQKGGKTELFVIEAMIQDAAETATRPSTIE